MAALMLLAELVAVQTPIKAAGKRIAIPVLIDASDYPYATDKLSDAIFFKVMKSKLITPNVDAPDAMIVKLLLPKLSPRRGRVHVLYTWHGRTIAKVTFPCAATQVHFCSTAIVRGAERASRSI